MGSHSSAGHEYKKYRAEGYRCLSSCLYLPDKERLHSGKLIEKLIEATDRVCPRASVFAREMESAQLRHNIQELTVEYAKLFVGPFELRAPPYGSVYLDEGRRIMGDSTMAVRRMYLDTKLNLSNDFKEPPDHISIELEFMYYLAFKEIEALESNNEDLSRSYLKKQAEVLEKYIFSWIPRFCSKVIQSSENPYYQSLGRCLNEFIANDVEYIDSILKQASLRKN